MPQEESVPFEMSEDRPLPYEEKVQTLDEIREDPVTAYAFIWGLRVELALMRAKLLATERKLNEVVSCQIGYLDPGKK